MAQDNVSQPDTLAPAADIFVVLRQVQNGGHDAISEKLAELFRFDPDECAEILNHLPVIISKCPDRVTAKHLKQQLASPGSEIDLSGELTEGCHRIIWLETFAEKIQIQPVLDGAGTLTQAQRGESRAQYFLMQYRRSESMRQKLLTYFQQTAREFEEMQKDYDAAQQRLEIEREKHGAERAKESEKQAGLEKKIIENEAQSAGKIRLLESALREQERRLNEARSALSAQNKTREQEKNKSAQLDDTRYKLEAELQKKDFELDDVRDATAKLGQRLEALERENALQKAALEEKSAELEVERQQVIALRPDYENRLQQRNHKFEAQEKTIAEQAKAIATALQEKKDLQTVTKQQALETGRRLSKLEQERKISAETIAAAKTEKGTLQNTIAKLKEKISELEIALVNRDPQNEAKIQDLMQKNETLISSLNEKEAGLLAKEALLIQEQGKASGLDQEIRRLTAVILQQELRTAELQAEIDNREKRLEQAAAELEKEYKKQAHTYAETQAKLNEREKKISKQAQMIQAQALTIQNENLIKADLQRQVDESFEADAQTRARYQKTIDGLKQDIHALEASLAHEKQSRIQLQNAKDEELDALRKDFALRADVFEQKITELEALISQNKEQAALFEKQSKKALADGSREREKEKAGAAKEIANKTAQIEKLTQDLNANHVVLAAEKEKGAELDSLQKMLESELTGAKTQITLLEKKLSEHKNKILEQTGNFDHINTLAEAFEKQLADTRRQAAHQENLRKQFEQENETKSKVITGLQDQLRERGEIMSEDKNKIAEITHALKKLETQLRGTETELRAENSRNQELEKNVQLKTELAEHLKDELSSVVRKHDELRVETEREGCKKDGQIEMLQKNLKNYAEENNKLRQQLKAQVETLAVETASLTALRQVSENLRQEIKNSTAELEAARSKQLQLNESIETHKGFFVSLEKALEEKEQESKVLQAAVLRAEEASAEMATALQGKDAVLREARIAADFARNAWEERLTGLEQKLAAHQKTNIRQTDEIERVKKQIEKERREALCEYEELQKAAGSEIFEKNKRIIFLENELQKMPHTLAELEDGMNLLALSLKTP